MSNKIITMETLNRFKNYLDENYNQIISDSLSGRIGNLNGFTVENLLGTINTDETGNIISISQSIAKLEEELAQLNTKIDIGIDSSTDEFGNVTISKTIGTLKVSDDGSGNIILS